MARRSAVDNGDRVDVGDLVAGKRELDLAERRKGALAVGIELTDRVIAVAPLRPPRVDTLLRLSGHRSSSRRGSAADPALAPTALADGWAATPLIRHLPASASVTSTGTPSPAAAGSATRAPRARLRA